MGQCKSNLFCEIAVQTLEVMEVSCNIRLPVLFMWVYRHQVRRCVSLDYKLVVQGGIATMM